MASFQHIGRIVQLGFLSATFALHLVIFLHLLCACMIVHFSEVKLLVQRVINANLYRITISLGKLIIIASIFF